MEAYAKAVIAFQGKQRIKEFYLERVRFHREADQLRQCFGYWEKDAADGIFRGCAVGCTLHSDDYFGYETELGIPSVLALLEDGLFESLPSARAMFWPEQFLSAIQPGADLRTVWPRFAYWLLVDPQYGVLQFAGRARTGESIQKTAHLYQRWIEGGRPSDEEFSAAYTYAFSTAADSIFGTGDAYAIRATAYAAAAASNYANAAGAANAASDAVPDQRRWRDAQADKLLSLIVDAPVMTR